MRKKVEIDKERERQAFLLWELLDRIDSLDDACREHDDFFRTLVYQVQRQRYSIMSEDDYVALHNKYYPTPVTGTEPSNLEQQSASA